MHEHSEEQQRRHGELLGAGAVQDGLDHLGSAQHVVGMPGPAIQLVAQAVAVDIEGTRQHGDIPLLEIHVLACHRCHLLIIVLCTSAQLLIVLSQVLPRPAGRMGSCLLQLR